MKQVTKKLLAQVNSAAAVECCFLPKTDSERLSLHRLMKSGEVVEPYCGMYATKDHWKKIWYADRVRHIAHTLAVKHPDWVFTGETAAALWGIDVFSLSNSYYPTIYIDSCRSNHGSKQAKQLCRLHIEGTQNCVSADHGKILILLNDLYTSLCVCAGTLSFRAALPAIDSAVKQKIDLSVLLQFCEKRYAKLRMYKNRTFCFNDDKCLFDNNLYFMNISNADVLSRLKALINFADGRSENPGESFARATMLAFGFAVPQLQVPFANPNDPTNDYRDLRVDFLWQVNEEVIVAEFDGVGKYQIDHRDPKQAKEYDGHRVISHDRDVWFDNFRSEHERERALYSSGVTRVVRFGFGDIANPEKLAGILLSAGVPTVSK